jgi:hypothetical protein
LGLLHPPVRDKKGNVVSPVLSPPRHHIAFRFFRLAQTSDDLFDAYRNMYLAFEALLSTKHPKPAAEELLLSLPELQKQRYTPVKKAQGKSWSKNADRDLGRSFKNLLVNLTGALDQFAEISAVLLYPALDKIPPGRASFSGLKVFIKKPYTLRGLVSPQTHFAEELKNKLLPLVDRSGPDKDWLELLQLFRNKLAHLGTSSFQYMCFHDQNCEFYTFPPRIWPRFSKQEVKTSLNPAANKTVSLESTAKQQLIHCDLVEYSAGVTKAVHNLLNAGFECVCDVYDLLKGAAPNQDAADAIMKQYEEYKFEHS